VRDAAAAERRLAVGDERCGRREQLEAGWAAHLRDAVRFADVRLKVGGDGEALAGEALAELKGELGRGEVRKCEIGEEVERWWRR
jgi:hypothetical protein